MELGASEDNPDRTVILAKQQPVCQGDTEIQRHWIDDGIRGSKETPNGSRFSQIDLDVRGRDVDRMSWVGNIQHNGGRVVIRIIGIVDRQGQDVVIVEY